MQRNSQRKLDDALHAVKELAATCAIAVFGLSAILGFGAALVQFVAEALSTKTGTWEAAKTVADMWPLIAGYVAAIEWSSLQHIGLLIIAQSVVWAYLGLGIVCIVICGVFVEVYDSLEQRQRWRHSLEYHKLVRNVSWH